MPSAAYINAAQAANRDAVVLMQVESVAAIKRSISSQADWLAGTVDGVLDRTSQPGRVILRHELHLTKEKLPMRGGYTPPAPVNAFIHPGVVAKISWQHDTQNSFPLRLALRKNNLSGQLIGYTEFVTITGIVVFSRGGINTYHATALFPASTPLAISQGDVVHVWPDRDAFDIIEEGKVELVTETASITTPTVDMGETPTQNTQVAVDAFLPHASTSVTVTAYGRNTTGEGWTNLGTVTDGASVAPYRYYYFVAMLASPQGVAGVALREISIQGGDSQYLYFGTHQDAPTPGVKPLIKSGGVSTVGGKIELMKLPTTGEVSVRMHWTPEVGHLVATGQLKNKAVLLKHGFAGLAESDYEPLFVGKWYDYEADPFKREITVKLRSALQQLTRLRLPEESVDASGNKTTTPISISGHVIDAMLTLYNLAGVRDRYLNRAAFELLRLDWYAPSSFTRASTAYHPDTGTQVAADEPRYKEGGGIFVEEGTTNAITSGPDTYNNLYPSEWLVEKIAPYTFRCTSLVNNPTTVYAVYLGTGGSAFAANESATLSIEIVERSTPLIRVGASGFGSIEGYGVLGNRIYRTITHTSAWNHRLAIAYPNAGVVAGDYIVVRQGQIERKPYATTFTDSTRVAELCTIPTAGVISPNEGTIELDVDVTAALKRQVAGQSSTRLFSISRSNDPSNNYLGIFLGHDKNTANWRLYGTDNAGVIKEIYIASASDNGYLRFSVRWHLGNKTLQVFIKGVLRGTVSDAKLPTSFGELISIGSNSTLYHQFANTFIGPIRFSSRARTDAELAYTGPLVADKDTTALYHFKNSLAGWSGPLAGSTYHVNRTLTSPEDADKLLNELAITAGIFPVPLPDGRITPLIYDPDAEAVAVLDATAMEFGKLAGGQKELHTQQLIYYDPATAEPGDNEKDYRRALIYYDQAAIAAWDERNQKRWYDKWNASATALHALGARMQSWFANPLLTVDVRDVPPRFMGLRQGDIVSVDNLPLPVESAQWPGLSAGVKFLVMSRDFDPIKSALRLTLLETGTLGDPGAGIIGTQMVISGPQKPFGAINSYTADGGSAPYTWTTTLGTLSAPTGQTVNLDVTGATGQGVLSVSDAGGTVTLRIEVLPPQVSGLAHLHTATGTLLRWTPAQDWVQEYEMRKGGTSWETSTFVARLRHTEINVGLLALGSHTYRLRGIDQWGNPSGQDAVHTLTIQAPSILSVNHSVIDNNVNLYWLSIPGNYPIASYRIYKGATWGTAEFIATADGTFHARFEKEAGVFTYWVQPLDLAGNFGAYGFSSANVSAPPDYIFFDNQAIDFAAATRSNLILDSGLLVGPATHTLGWDAHLAAHSFATPQAQIDGGYPYFAQPTPASGYVESVIDFGATIPATLVTLEISWRTVAGAVTLTPALQVASDPAGPWTDLGETWEARAEGFRYVKARVTLTGANETALAEVSDISVRLDVKEKNDAVAYVADAADTDGTWVAFSKTFIDIISIVPVAAHQSGIDGIIAQVRFVDEPNPTGFYVYHFRRDTGARISGAGSATIRGV